MTTTYLKKSFFKGSSAVNKLQVPKNESKLLSFDCGMFHLGEKNFRGKLKPSFLSTNKAFMKCM